MVHLDYDMVSASPARETGEREAGDQPRTHRPSRPGEVCRERTEPIAHTMPKPQHDKGLRWGQPRSSPIQAEQPSFQ